MKIATFNINNVNRRLPNLLNWLKSAKPEIVCLQELKCTDAEFPVSPLAKAGYRSVWWGQKNWNGVNLDNSNRREAKVSDMPKKNKLSKSDKKMLTKAGKKALKKSGKGKPKKTPNRTDLLLVS
jgi:exonuclease III